MQKRTHLIYIAITLVLIGTCAWWINHSYEHDHAAEHYIQHVKDFPLLDPALPFYNRDDLIVNIQELRSYLFGLPEQNKDWSDVSIYFEVMSTGANISVNGTNRIWPASLAKLPISMIAMKKVEKGDWDLGTKFLVREQHVTGSDKEISKLKIGSTHTLEQVISIMLTDSDNVAYRMLTEKMSDEELLSISEAVGLEQLYDQDAKVSTREYTRLFRALHSATYLDMEASEKLLELLDYSAYKGMIRSGLPDDVKFSHKWGINDVENVYGDSGIVFLKDKTFLISIMVQGKGADHNADQVKAEALIAEAGKRAYEFMANANNR